jgi:hypothetical protein
MSRPPKSAESIILATLPEPDRNPNHDGRFTGRYVNGVVTITFERFEPGLSPEECEEDGVADEGDGSVQLVEREALLKALGNIPAYMLSKLAMDAATKGAPEDFWRKTLTEVLFR